MQCFESRTETGGELFSYLPCFLTTTLTLLIIFSLVQTISLKIWERLRSEMRNVHFQFAQKLCLLEVSIVQHWFVCRQNPGTIYVTIITTIPVAFCTETTKSDR